jgi:hypothetical protein
MESQLSQESGDKLDYVNHQKTYRGSQTDDQSFDSEAMAEHLDQRLIVELKRVEQLGKDKRQVITKRLEAEKVRAITDIGN